MLELFKDLPENTEKVDQPAWFEFENIKEVVFLKQGDYLKVTFVTRNDDFKIPALHFCFEDVLARMYEVSDEDDWADDLTYYSIEVYKKYVDGELDGLDIQGSKSL